MAELNEVVNEVKDVVADNAPQIAEAAKEIIVKVPNVLAERAKGFAAGATAAVVVLKGIPAAFKAVKGLITKKTDAAIETTGEFVEDNIQQEDFNEVDDEPEQEESEEK